MKKINEAYEKILVLKGYKNLDTNFNPCDISIQTGFRDKCENPEQINQLNLVSEIEVLLPNYGSVFTVNVVSDHDYFDNIPLEMFAGSVQERDCFSVNVEVNDTVMENIKQENPEMHNQFLSLINDVSSNFLKNPSTSVFSNLLSVYEEGYNNLSLNKKVEVNRILDKATETNKKVKSQKPRG